MITFAHLHPDHFMLLCEWLNEPHVATWWSGPQTLEAVIAKYSTYTQHFKIVDGAPKPINAFVMEFERKPIGYIQVYDARIFTRKHTPNFDAMSSSLASIDLFIGDPAYLGRGLGAMALKAFLTLHVWPYFERCFIDPDEGNIAAIRAYEKAGFREISREAGVVQMLAARA